MLALYRQFPQYVLGCANYELAVFYPIACGVAPSVLHCFSDHFDGETYRPELQAAGRNLNRFFDRVWIKASSRAA